MKQDGLQSSTHRYEFFQKVPYLCRPLVTGASCSFNREVLDRICRKQCDVKFLACLPFSCRKFSSHATVRNSSHTITKSLKIRHQNQQLICAANSKLTCKQNFHVNCQTASNFIIMLLCFHCGNFPLVIKNEI